MEELGLQMTAGLPVWFRMVFILFITVVAVFYILPRIRRDKNGKWYLYSQKYEDNKRNEKQNRTLDTLDKLTDSVNTLKTNQCDMYMRLNEHIEKDVDIIAKIDKDIADSKVDRNDLGLTNLKQSVYLKEMPIEERIYDGLKYLNRGGNGAVKKYIINELISKAPISYHAIIRVKPELAITGVSVMGEPDV